MVFIEPTSNHSLQIKNDSQVLELIEKDSELKVFNVNLDNASKVMVEKYIISDGCTLNICLKTDPLIQNMCNSKHQIDSHIKKEYLEITQDLCGRTYLTLSEYRHVHFTDTSLTALSIGIYKFQISTSYSELQETISSIYN